MMMTHTKSFPRVVWLHGNSFPIGEFSNTAVDVRKALRLNARTNQIGPADQAASLGSVEVISAIF
jgi:hypothetical protein